MEAVNKELELQKNGVSSGYFFAVDGRWKMTVIGDSFHGTGYGDTIDEATQAAVLDLRQQIAKAMGGIAVQP